MNQLYDTVVIGAGMAGLTLASELGALGRTVMVLERADTVGGAVQTVEVDGFRIEEGPNSLLDTSPEVTALLSRIGLEKRRVFANKEASKRYVVRNGRPVALPFTPRQFFTSPLFSWRAKLRLLREPFTSAWENRYEESIADFVIRRLGNEFLDYAINPFVAGVYAGDPHRLSVMHAFPKLYALEQRYGSLIKGQIRGARERRKRAESSKRNARMYSFEQGLIGLPAALATDLEGRFVTRSTVIDITHDIPFWKVVYRNEQGEKQTLVTRSVAYAGRITDFAKTGFKPVGSGLKRKWAEVLYPPVTVLGLGFASEAVEHALDGFGMLVPEVEQRSILGTLFSSTLFPNRAPAGHVLLTVFVGGTRQPDLAQLGTDELLPIVLRDLQDLLIVHGTPVMIHRRTWPQAIPQYTLGYGAVKSELTAMEEAYPGLFFAGNYREGISVPDTIKSSLGLAQRVVGFLNENGIHVQDRPKTGASITSG